MKNTDKQAFRTLINGRIAALLSNSSNSKDARAPVELDQQSVGRLSRMDALQLQSLNNATEGRRKAELIQLTDALARIETEEFGYCDDCGEEIPPKRLELLLTTRLCVTCASG